MFLTHRSFLRLILMLLVLAGCALRFSGLDLPDMSTDEAQFALGASAAQPPFGMETLTAAQKVFGTENVVVRAVSGAWGMLGVLLLASVAGMFAGRRAAILAGLIALFFPSHMMFSRLAYLSAPLTTGWLLVLTAFLLCERKTTPWRILGLYTATIVATFLKTQALLVPVGFLAWRIVTLRRRVFVDPVAWALLIGLIPIGIYIVTHPGIGATLLQYGGNQYGVGNLPGRVMDLAVSYRHVMGAALFALPLAIPSLRRMPAAWWITLAAGLGQGLLLGPQNPYYATDLVLFAVPLSMTVITLSSRMRLIAMTAIIGIFSLAATDVIARQRENNYWETHADAINKALSDAQAVIVLGPAGHHMRWYLRPRVYVGHDMSLNSYSGPFLLLDPVQRTRVPDAEEIYNDGTVVIVKREQ